MKKAAILVLLASACVSVSPAGQKVKLILDPQAPSLTGKCELLEERTKLPAGMWATTPTDDRVQSALKNDAAKMGSDTVQIVQFGASPSRWFVKFYRCAGK